MVVPANITAGTPSRGSIIHASEDGSATNSKGHLEEDISRLQSAAREYSASLTYGIGDFVQESNTVYINTTAITTPEAFTVSKWEAFLSDTSPTMSDPNFTGTATAENLVITGNLLVDGTTVTKNAETINLGDNHIYLNSGYTAVAAESGGFVVNYLPTSTADTVLAGAFVAGIAATSNPTVTTVGAATFATGDLIQVSDSDMSENDGIYEVESHAANLLTIRGIGLVATVQDFSDNQFIANASDNAVITKVNVSTLHAGTDGIWETAKGSVTGFVFDDLVMENATQTVLNKTSHSPNGTELLPPYAFENSVSTGMRYDSATPSLAFSLGGKDILKLTASGKNYLKIVTVDDDIEEASVQLIPDGEDANTNLILNGKGGGSVNINIGSGDGEVFIGENETIEISNAGAVSIGTQSNLAAINTSGNVLLLGANTANGTRTRMIMRSPADSKNITIGVNNLAVDSGSMFLENTDGTEMRLRNIAGTAISISSLNTTLGGTLNLPTAADYQINSVSVLSSTTLGSGVVSSSLTSLGTLNSLTISDDLTVDTDTFFVDAANKRVGINTTTTISPLTFANTVAAITATPNRISLFNPGFGFGVSSSTLNIQSGANIRFYSGTSILTELAVLHSNGGFGINVDTPDANFHVESDDADTTAISIMASLGANAGITSTRVGSQDPDGIVTGLGGEIYIRDNGILSDIYFNKEAISGTDWESISTNPSTIIEISSTAELEARPEVSAGTFTLTQNTTIDLKAAISSTTNFALNGFSLTIDGHRRAGVTWTYSGTGNFTSGTGSFRLLSVLQMISSSTGTFLSLQGEGVTVTVVVLQESAIIGWDNLGTISDATILQDTTRYTQNTIGFTLTDCNPRFTTVGAFNSTATTPLFTINAPAAAILGTISNTIGTNNTAVFKINPGINNDTRMLFSDSAFSGSNFFETSGGSTGTFTAVANAAIAATTITGVTDSSGVARFAFTGVSTFVHQEVVISGFTTNTDYNGTFIITATDGSTYFEIASIDFGTTETGSFLSNSVTLTDTATTLSNGDTLVIDTDDSTDYDTGATVYNKLTNTVQINRTFTVTKSGTWDTSGIDQTDPRVLSLGITNFADSQYKAEGVTNANTTATTITDGTYAAISAGTFTVITDERFKLIDDIAAIWEYTANEPFNGKLTGNLSGIKTGSTGKYRIAMSTNGVVPTFATANYIQMEVKTTTIGTPLEFSVILNKGDTIQLMMAGDGTSDNITVTDLKTGIQ